MTLILQACQTYPAPRQTKQCSSFLDSFLALPVVEVEQLVHFCRYAPIPSQRWHVMAISFLPSQSVHLAMVDRLLLWIAKIELVLRSGMVLPI